MSPFVGLAGMGGRSPFSPLSSSSPIILLGDPNYEYCTLHIPGDSPTLEVGRSGSTLVPTASVTSTTSNKKFSSAIDLDNSGSDPIKFIRVPNCQEITFHTGDFCIEGWIYLDSDDTNVVMNARIFQMGANQADGYSFLYNANNIYVGRTDEVLMSDSRSNWNDGWHHFAITRSSGTMRLFRDGTQVSTANNTTDNNSTDDLYIGVYPGDLGSKRSNFKLEDFRMYKGIAKYTSNFTPIQYRNPEYSFNTGDIGTRDNPATNANAIWSANNAASSGAYWISDGTGGSRRMYCEMTNFGGWMLVAMADGSTSPIPTGGTYVPQFGGGRKFRLSDTEMNNLNWTYCWLGMTDNDTDSVGYTSGSGSMDRQRQLFSTNGVKFNIGFNTNSSSWTSGSKDNGRNQLWSYKGPDGAGGPNLSGSPRQNGTVINGAGSTDRVIGNTNTYGIAPHDAGIGGAWIFAGNGTDGGGNFNNGFDADHNNVDWETRYAYWFLK